jgi:hypothetical protein
MRRRMYYRNVEAVYTLSSILLNPLIRYGGIRSTSGFDPTVKMFWFVLTGIEATLEFDWSSAIPEFIAELDKDVDNPVFHINCDEEELEVNLI